MRTVSLRKAVLSAAAGVLAAAGLVAASGSAAQANGPTYRISPEANQLLFLDVSGGSTGDGAPIILWPLSGDNQAFTLEPSGSHFQLVNKKSHKCVTTDGVAGHQLYQWVCHGPSDLNQLWDTGLTPGFKVYQIRSVGSGLSMDVTGGVATQGAAVGTWSWNGGYGQYWAALAA